MMHYILAVLAIGALALIFRAYKSPKKKAQPKKNKRHTEVKSPLFEKKSRVVSPPAEYEEDGDAILGLKKPVTHATVETPEPVRSKKPSRPLKVVTLHLLSPKQKPFAGYELLQALLSNALRFGQYKIFHRHENKNGTGSVLFSVTSINKPGSFDLSKMGAYSCPGLSLFLPLDAKNDLSSAFKVMLDTVHQLQDDLGGVILDSDRRALSDNKIASLSQYIDQHESTLRTSDLFETLDE